MVPLPEMTDPFSAPAETRRYISSLWQRWQRFAARISGRELKRVPARTPAPYIGFGKSEIKVCKGKVLMSYLAEPFHDEGKSVFNQNASNHAMSFEMAKAFVRLGYTVDIVDWKDTDFVPNETYDVFLGMTANFDRIRSFLPPTTMTLYWATRPERAFEVQAIWERIRQLELRRGVRLPFPEYLEDLLESKNFDSADAVIALGNPTITASFAAGEVQVYPMDNLALPLSDPDLNAKNFASARRNFLFLSSWFLVRKGLDLVLDAFSSQQCEGLHLWICAPLESELDFLKLYRQELFHNRQIHPIGWVDMRSPKFETLCAQCAFLVFPTCAEGMAGSVLNCMAKGLIPIVSPECGVDLENVGISIEEHNPRAIASLVLDAASWSPEKCRQYANANRELATTRYSVERFGTNFEAILREVLNQELAKDAAPNWAG